MRRILLTLLFLSALPAFAQNARSPLWGSTKADRAMSRALTNGGLFAPPPYTTATKPACTALNAGALITNTSTPGMEQCLSGSWTAIGGGASGITIGTTSIASGTATRVLFHDTGDVVGEDADFTFNKTTNFLTTGGYVVPNSSSTTPLFTSAGGASGINATATALYFVGASTIPMRVEANVIYVTGTFFGPGNSDGGVPLASSSLRWGAGWFKNGVSHAYNITAKTTGYTIVSSDQLAVITNTGASGSVTLTLPASAGNGHNVKVCRLASQTLVLDPAGTDLIKYVNASGAVATTNGGTLSIGTDFCCIEVIDMVTGTWVAPNSPAAGCSLTAS